MSLVQNEHALKIKVVDSDTKYQNAHAIKVKVEGGGGIEVDDALSTTSENPVQNKVITAAVGGKQDTLTAGENITIENNVISASGGGGESGKLKVRTLYVSVESVSAYNARWYFWQDAEHTIPYTYGDFWAENFEDSGSGMRTWNREYSMLKICRGGVGVSERSYWYSCEPNWMTLEYSSNVFELDIFAIDARNNDPMSSSPSADIYATSYALSIAQYVPDSDQLVATTGVQPSTSGQILTSDRVQFDKWSTSAPTFNAKPGTIYMQRGEGGSAPFKMYVCIFDNTEIAQPKWLEIVSKDWTW